MIPKRPYLFRAFYEWIVDNGMTPYILVNAEAEDVNVPRQHIKDGKIVLNVSPVAVHDYILDNDALSFSARFGGVSFYIYCPMYAIEAVYAQESPEDGVSFSATEYDDLEQDEAAGAKKSAPFLSAVSSEPDSEVAESTDDEQVEASDSDDDSPPSRKRPSLRVVK